MSRVTHVCLSDFHAGSKYSLLTHLDPSGRPVEGDQSPTLKALSHALQAFLPEVSDGGPPTLVLLGDILDMAISRRSTAMKVFQRCIEALFPEDGRELFSKRIIFLPGNHDHILWQPISARLGLALDVARGRRGVSSLPPVSKVFEEPDALPPSELLTDLCRDLPGMQSAEVFAGYPNWGFRGSNSTVVFHHGHFIEEVYRLITLTRRKLRPTDKPVTVAELEVENGSWIDFGWSTLGAAGGIGHKLGSLHSIMQSERGSEDFLGRLSSLLARGISARIPFGSEPKVQNSVAMVTKASVNTTLGQMMELERLSFLDVLSRNGLKGLRWYLDEPLVTQIRDEKQGTRVENIREQPLTFIFGHTHKPFEDEIVATNYREPVRVFNTGGWILDEPRLDTVQGASMILIDEHANVAALRLFGCPVNGVPAPVEVRGTGRFSDMDNPLIRNLERVLGNSRGQWQSFTRTAAAELQVRRKVIADDVLGSEQLAPDGTRLL
jgi:UDP-2,3-diacylglucosamine pyrophosphatase LpxH